MSVAKMAILSGTIACVLSYNADLSADSPCDSLCRERKTFYNSNVVTFFRYKYATCSRCTVEGLCKPTIDDSYPYTSNCTSPNQYHGVQRVWSLDGSATLQCSAVAGIDNYQVTDLEVGDGDAMTSDWYVCTIPTTPGGQ